MTDLKGTSGRHSSSAERKPSSSRLTSNRPGAHFSHSGLREKQALTFHRTDRSCLSSTASLSTTSSVTAPFSA